MSEVSPDVSVRAVGDAALRVDVPARRRHAVAAALVAGVPAALDVVPGETSVLVSFDPLCVDVEALTDAVLAACRDTPVAASQPAGAELVVPVTYDGADLADVAALVGLSSREVVARHTAARYVVAFVGFAPGFAYLDGLDPMLRVPRMPTPRTRVEAGAVAIAGDRTCVYPKATPGGWRLLGRTDFPTFDPDADPPTLLAAGRVVRFVEA